MQALFWTILGLFLGSIPFSLLVAKYALHTDIRTMGDGNPGGFNVWLAGGRSWAVIAILLDGLKGAVPVGLAHYIYGISGWSLIPVALAPLIGHIFSPFLKFHGGKGLATTFGIWLGLTLWLGPTVFGLSLFVWKKGLQERADCCHSRHADSVGNLDGDRGWVRTGCYLLDQCIPIMVGI